MIVIKPLGGLCNRMRVIKSLVAINSYKSNTRIIVLWEKNNELYATFNQLFEKIPNIKVINTNAITTKIIYFVVKNILRFKIVNKQTILQKFKRTDNINELFFLNKNNIIETDIDFFMPNFSLSFFKLLPELQKTVNQFVLHHQLNTTIGLHIRRSDNNVSIKNSPIELFEQKINQELELNNKQQFFLASDSEEVINEFKAKYPNKIITFANNKSRNEEAGIQEALIELYLLSKTYKVYGSYWSSFSEMAIQLNNNKQSKILKQ